MTKKIFRGVFFVAVAVMLSCIVLIMGALYGYFDSVQKNQLKTELSLAAQAIESGAEQYLERLEGEECRFTRVAADGTVMFDSKNDAETMENHAQREEIKQAFEIGFGESTRFSSTLTEKTIYYAKLLHDGTVLRISVSRAAVPALVFGMLQPILIVAVSALILSAFLAHRLSAKIAMPLNSIDLSKPLENNVYDELSPLLTHIEKQHRQIKKQKKELTNRQNEFYAVIENMNEGLVLLNKDGIILSINPAAVLFFAAEPECVGKDFLTVERSREIDKALSDAREKGQSEIQISRNGREYQLNASRIEVSGKGFGLVILVFDITDKVFAERNRREFTANVSHELKTPLQAIMGSAELIENGMVKAQDMPRFVGHIRSEAARLLALIEDIIRLSQLDESDGLPLEDVDLFELAKLEAEPFAQIAAEKGVEISVEGESAVVNGVRQLLHEVVYNLLDNAVKYNKRGGSVKVNVGTNENGVFVSVSDTGIGIPAEHQARVFERFYRVDKSRSKETGGTGLGLSIVKHAVQYMGGRIALESEPGEGTTVTVIF